MLYYCGICSISQDIQNFVIDVIHFATLNIALALVMLRVNNLRTCLNSFY
jgi:hypothetical protein